MFIRSNIFKITIIFTIFKTIFIICYEEKKRDLIYILLFNSITEEPFILWPKQNKIFIKNNCTYQNCYIIKDRNYFMDITDYDVLVFDVAPDLYRTSDFPMARSDNQIYIFFALEPQNFFALVDEKHNWFFNYTWTYRLDSDIVYPYIIATNRQGKIVGPKLGAHFRSAARMKPTPQYVIDKLVNKTNAAAWFVTNCQDSNHRLGYGHALNKALENYNLSVDIFGLCGNKVCTKELNRNCLKLVENRYYFYLAFENSNCEDYVSEKILTALNHYAVPIVLGGAKYSNFLSDGIYLNANTHSEEDMASKIYEIMQDKQTYYDFFKWHRYYNYRSSSDGPNGAFCNLCDFLNKETTRNQRRVYARFTEWWNEDRPINESKEYVVKYEDSLPYFKSFVTYREVKFVPKITIETQSSTAEKVNDFLDDIVNYFFGS